MRRPAMSMENVTASSPRRLLSRAMNAFSAAAASARCASVIQCAFAS